MHKLKISLFLFFPSLIISTATTFAATLPDENAAKEFADSIVSKVGSGNLEEAFKMIKNYTNISERDLDGTLQKTKSEWKKNKELYGPSEGYELIDSKKAGDGLVRYRYILKYEKGLRYWSVHFYKTNRGWILNAFEWKNDYKEIFD